MVTKMNSCPCTRYADDVWRFATNPEVPFTHHLAEQAVRMSRVKQKVSGGCRIKEGADTYCIIDSYLATTHQPGANLFLALILTFRASLLSLASLGLRRERPE